MSLQELKTMEDVHVRPEMLETILTASLQTARRYYGCAEEMYSLGQLEATANLVYVILCSRNTLGKFPSIEILCQEYSTIAVERMEELNAILGAQSSQVQQG